MRGFVSHASLVLLVLLAQVEFTGSVTYILENEVRTFESARQQCKTKGGDLVDFADQYSIDETKRLMQEKTVQRVWLNSKETLNPWFWVNDCTLLRNQGCYVDKSKVANQPFKTLQSGETPDMATYTPITSLRRDQCLTLCQGSGQTFGSLQLGSLNSENTFQNLCGCGPSYGKYLLISESSCPKCSTAGAAEDEFCPVGDHFARVFAVGGTAYPEWDEYWHEDKAKYDNCGAFSQETTLASSKFKALMCSDSAVPLCQVTPRLEQSIQLPRSQVWVRALIHQTSTWYEARQACKALQGADLFKVDTKEKVEDLLAGAMSSTPGHFWIAAIKTRWPWLNEQTLCPSAAVSWPAGHPDSCLLFNFEVGGQAKREKESCAGSAAYVCKLGGTSDQTGTGSGTGTGTTTTTPASAASATTTTDTVAGLGQGTTQKGTPVNRGAVVGGSVLFVVATYCICELIYKFICCIK